MTTRLEALPLLIDCYAGVSRAVSETLRLDRPAAETVFGTAWPNHQSNIRVPAEAHRAMSSDMASWAPTCHFAIRRTGMQVEGARRGKRFRAPR
jgi:hypothetical protein